MTIQIDLVWGLCEPRFEAFWSWHKVLAGKRLPDWDKHDHPLWPAEYGSVTWETGSGALSCAEPRPPHGVKRSDEHEIALRRAVYSKPFRRRQPGDTPLQRLLDFRLEIPEEGEL